MLRTSLRILWIPLAFLIMSFVNIVPPQAISARIFILTPFLRLFLESVKGNHIYLDKILGERAFLFGAIFLDSPWEMRILLLFLVITELSPV